MRRRLLNLLIVAVIAIHAACFLTDQQHWPFLTYPMFSWVRGNLLVDNLIVDSPRGPVRAIECLVVHGIPKDRSLPEVPMLGAQTHPLRAIRLRYAFQKIETHPHRSAAFRELEQRCAAMESPHECIRERLTDRALADVITLYETSRKEGRHSGSDLSGARLYRVRSLLTPELTATASISKTLLFEHSRVE